MFSLIHGNRQELLARHLANHLRTDPLSLFEREVVVVQSGGMARWLQLALAEELGVAAQFRFTFPAGYIWELFGEVLPDVPDESPFSTEVLVWQLLRLLPTLPDLPAHQAVRDYLADGDIVKRYGLAQRLAEIFDRYLAYRPEWVGTWLQGRTLGLSEPDQPHETWQAWLWKAIGDELTDLPEAHPAELFFKALEKQPSLLSKLPKRISIFGVGAMPPPYLDIFKRLGEHIDVSIYMVNPCREYWGDLVNSRTVARAALAAPETLPLLEVGHPLLGSLGRVTRDFFDHLAGGNDEDIFVEPSGTRLLDMLHADLLDMRSRSIDERLPLAADDRSIQFHVCHSSTREIEVLHDHLLERFAADPSLQPHDVLILTPDLPGVAPLIEAVFASAPATASGKTIPFTVADKPLSLEAPLLRAFNALLALVNGRCDAESVLAFLAEPCVAQRFGFDDEALEDVRAWVGESGIRWGLSAAWRAKQGLPAEAAHTWRAGLERMLLGVALPQSTSANFALNDGASGARQLFNGLLPYDAIEGVRAQTLGRLLGFIDALTAALDQLAIARSVADWAVYLPQLCQRFCLDESRPENADAEDQRALQTLRTALQKLARAAERAGSVEAIPLDVIRRALRNDMAAMPPGWAFLGGGVTVAALRAYRGVPMRVVCLIGMNDGVFPRNPATPSFDLLAREPRRGDRDTRDEDRHAFLEALLSARECLHISYVGRGIRDNSPLPPSTLVAELRDVIDQTVVVNQSDTTQEGSVEDDERITEKLSTQQLITQKLSTQKPSEWLTVHHRLQPFSPRYFDGHDPALFSYATAYARASTASLQTPPVAQPFLTQALTPPDDELLNITPQQLLRFFRNPAQHLLRHRLGIHLEESEGLLETVEPFVPNALERYFLRTTLVADAQQGADTLTAALALAQAQGGLPHGQAGQVLFEREWDALVPFVARVREQGGQLLPPCRIQFAHAGVQLSGSLGGLLRHDSGVIQLHWRVGKVRPLDQLTLWLLHVQLHACGQTCESVLLTPADELRVPPIGHAEATVLLRDLLAIYAQGCCSVLPFFPATSLAWLSVERGLSRKNWQVDWVPAPFHPDAESTDPYVQQAWGLCDPLSKPYFEDFTELAERVYGPMLDHVVVEEEEGA